MENKTILPLGEHNDVLATSKMPINDIKFVYSKKKKKKSIKYIFIARINNQSTRDCSCLSVVGYLWVH